MRLAELLNDIAGELGSEADREISGLAYDSRLVKEGNLFACISGLAADGHIYAQEAVAKGAAALLVSRDVGSTAVPAIKVPDVRRALAKAAAAFYEHPSERLSVIGVTGTNGKTTTAYLVEGICRAAGRKTGVVGTIENRIDHRVLSVTHTTPESVDLQELLSEMVAAGVQDVAIEVSSHALDQGRVEGTRFKAVVFTNLSQDHLDYHATLEDYFLVKRRLFLGEYAKDAVRIVNVDDEYGRRLAAECRAAGVNVVDFGVGQGEIRAEGVTSTASGSRLRVVSHSGAFDRFHVNLRLQGMFNVHNCLAATAAGLALGVPTPAIKIGLESVDLVPGRFETVDTGQPFMVVVDYAHTPDSLEKLLRSARPLTSRRVIVVFGCGGDRDRGKRPIMGRAAAELADMAIITSDNPRSEDPEAIIDAIEEGAKLVGSGNHLRMVERREAIEYALSIAEPGDTVLIAGKGHERGQQIGDKKIPFDDAQVAREYLGALSQC